VNDSEAQEIILLPLQKTFKKVGFCGSLGNAEVKLFLMKLVYDNFPYSL
jgi:hypothetical protein